MKKSKCEVRLIGRTQPIEGNTGTTTANELVAYTARVSNPTNQNNNKTASKLVRYLIKHQHWSPFEMVHLTLEIKTTRDISRQILRHRSFAFQEFSQRYAESETFVEREARMQDKKNRQNSLVFTDDMTKEIFSNSQSELMDIAERVYRSALMSQDRKGTSTCVVTRRSHRNYSVHGRKSSQLDTLLSVAYGS